MTSKATAGCGDGDSGRMSITVTAGSSSRSRTGVNAALARLDSGNFHARCVYAALATHYYAQGAFDPASKLINYKILNLLFFSVFFSVFFCVFFDNFK